MEPARIARNYAYMGRDRAARHRLPVCAAALPAGGPAGRGDRHFILAHLPVPVAAHGAGAGNLAALTMTFALGLLLIVPIALVAYNLGR